MGLRLYNTLSRKLEPFEPLAPPRVGVYACGPTIYDYAHIGNFRSFLFYDLVHRYLEWRGYDVRFVMNFTDVDDKTIEAARREKTSIREYTDPYADAFLDEAEALGVRPMDLYPRATGYVTEMIDLVRRLVDRGLGYVAEDGSVYFDISAFPDYGKLSRKDLSRARRGERVAADEYEKDDVRDFALWKAAKPQDEEVGAAWDAPWARGRPGWHLECSAMALAEVGETVDIHLGGEDLIFPHHEDEIAQSEGATGEPFVRYWLHAKHLLVEGRKMSKSLGNFITVRELLDEGTDPAALRHQLLSGHYRSELNFTRDGLAASGRAVQRVLDFEDRLRAHPVEGDGTGVEEGSDGTDGKVGEEDGPERGRETGGGNGTEGGGLARAADEAVARFTAAMDDDLNVAEGMAALFFLVGEGNQALDRAPVVEARERDRALEALASLDRVLGLVEVARKSRQVDPELREWVEERIRARKEAREERDWDRADAIRDELAERGVILEDGPAGTRWKLAGTGG